MKAAIETLKGTLKAAEGLAMLSAAAGDTEKANRFLDRADSYRRAIQVLEAVEKATFN